MHPDRKQRSSPQGICSAESRCTMARPRGVFAHLDSLQLGRPAPSAGRRSGERAASPRAGSAGRLLHTTVTVAICKDLRACDSKGRAQPACRLLQLRARRSPCTSRRIRPAGRGVWRQPSADPRKTHAADAAAHGCFPTVPVLPHVPTCPILGCVATACAHPSPPCFSPVLPAHRR